MRIKSLGGRASPRAIVAVAAPPTWPTRPPSVGMRASAYADSSRRGVTLWDVSPRAKHDLARDHLDVARDEVEEDHIGVVATLLLHAAEAAIDALAEANGIETSPTHWRREEM